MTDNGFSILSGILQTIPAEGCLFAADSPSFVNLQTTDGVISVQYGNILNCFVFPN
jgi:hypothetical protein